MDNHPIEAGFVGEVLALVEARRMKVLGNPNDPSWTEHFAELANEIRTLAAQPQHRRFDMGAGPERDPIAVAMEIKRVIPESEVLLRAHLDYAFNSRHMLKIGDRWKELYLILNQHAKPKAWWAPVVNYIWNGVAEDTNSHA